MDKLAKKHPWLKKEKLVVKPDQLFGKRGKHGLILLDTNYADAKKWIKQKMNKETKVGKVKGKLTHFLIEPFTPHETEYYIAIKGNRHGDVVYFSNHGGVDIESVWDTVSEIKVGVNEDINKIDIEKQLPKDTLKENKKIISVFIKGLYKFYDSLGYSYFEINPFAIVK